MISTPRFIFYWVAVSLPLPLAQRLLFAPLPTSRKELLWGEALTGLVLLVTAWLQGRLLARYRRPVKYWPAAALAGWVIWTVALASLTFQVLRSGSGIQGDAHLRAYLVVSTATYSLCTAAPKAMALWGFHRSNLWILWLSGHLVLSLGFLAAVEAAAALVPHSAVKETLEIVLFMTVSAAVTAWMLDRLAFPRTEEPYLAGSSSDKS